MRQKTKLNDQKGIVSFMVTLIMMMVISLIVIGFTQVTNRNRREALDRQLSAQAFYAAESGVNQAITEIMGQAFGSVANKDTCANTGTYDAFSLNSSGVDVTCIMVNTIPDSIVGSASQTSSFVTYIHPVNSTNSGSPAIDTLTFTWRSAEMQTPQPGGCTGTHMQFPVTPPATCAFGLLRVDLFQFESNQPKNKDNTTTLYLQPLTAQNSYAINNTSDKNTHVFSADCDLFSCKVEVPFSGNASNKKYYARLSSLYREIPSFEITGKLNTTETMYFKDAQAIIDSTGRAQDVLRRIQVRYPLGGGDETPPWAVAGRVCKRLNVVPAPPVYTVTNDPTTCN